MFNLSIDLETMGTAPDAPITNIGAVFFDTDTGQLGKEFYCKVSLPSNMDHGRIPSASTIEWWLNQEKAAQQELTGGRRETLPNALYSLTFFIHSNQSFSDKVCPWGNGATFDISILENAYKCVEGKGGVVPWKFWNVRDVRTIVALGQDIGIDAKNQIPFDGVAHNALADAKHQAKVVMTIWSTLTAIFKPKG